MSNTVVRVVHPITVLGGGCVVGQLVGIHSQRLVVLLHNNKGVAWGVRLVYKHGGDECCSLCVSTPGPIDPSTGHALRRGREAGTSATEWMACNCNDKHAVSGGGAGQESCRKAATLTGWKTSRTPTAVGDTCQAALAQCQQHVACS